MAYKNTKVPDLRLVKTYTYQNLTIDLGKQISGTVTAFMKKEGSDNHYREFKVDPTGQFLSLNRGQTVDLVEDSITYEIAGRWYLNVWQVKDGENDNEANVVYTGKILFIESMSDFNGSNGGVPVDEDVFFFQFDGVSDDISNIDLIDADFLALYGQELTVSGLESGQNITLGLLGRFGFYMETSTNPPFTIFNELGADITASFDYIYQDGAAYFVSQEFSVPSTVYFKIESI
jgi:hypothetical protein